jgi:type II secretory pathway component PulM
MIMKLRATIAGFWAGCTARQRAAVAAAIAVAAGTALYLLLWEPGLAARQSLSAALPRLRAQLEDMRWQREEVVALRKGLGASTPLGDLAALLRASAAQAPFTSAIERIESLPGGKVRMRAGPLPFDAWLAWIENAQRELGIRIDACRISALDQPGMVRLEAIFAAGGGR